MVVVQTEYPGASPEIVENEVTRKVEEAVNTITGINQLYSRSYEGTSVVIIQFDLESRGARRPTTCAKRSPACDPLRDEVKEAARLAFRPGRRPIYTLAVTSPNNERSLQELTTLADQVVKKRLENVRGRGPVTLVGGAKREIKIYLRPQAMEALRIGVDQVVAALRSENQDLPAGALRPGRANRWCRSTGG